MGREREAQSERPQLLIRVSAMGPDTDKPDSLPRRTADTERGVSLTVINFLFYGMTFFGRFGGGGEGDIGIGGWRKWVGREGEGGGGRSG